MTFSAITFNMQNGQPWDDEHPDTGEIHIGRGADFLREQDADILFLQEVECGHDGGRQADPPPHYTRLRALLPGYDSVFSYPRPNATEIPFGLGQAVFSKTKLRDFQALDLPAAEMEFEFGGRRRRPSQRLLLAVTTVIFGRPIRLFNVHLQAFFMIGGRSADHPAPLDIIEAELRRQTGPALLAGDLNSAPDEDTISRFERTGFRTAQKEAATWKRKPFVVDHIFSSPALRLESHAVIPTLASDHPAVRAEFSFA